MAELFWWEIYALAWQQWRRKGWELTLCLTIDICFHPRKRTKKLGTAYAVQIAYTATKMPFMYSQTRICVASVPVSTFMCLWAIYILPRGAVQIFFCSTIGRPSLEIYKSVTDTWLWKLDGGRTMPILGIFVSNFRSCFFEMWHTWHQGTSTENLACLSWNQC